MGTYLARVEVRLKPGYSDPEGETTKESLVNLRYRVKRVGVGKIYEIELDAPSIEEARKQVEEMCWRLLANPVKDDYKLEVREVK